MKLSDLLEEGGIVWVKAKNKWSFFEEIAKPLSEITNLPAEEISRVLEERERLGTTAIGNEIALPHSRLPQLDRLVLAVGLKKEGLDFEALDGQPVKIIFVILAPENEAHLYLKVLAYLAKILKNEDLRQKLLTCQNPQEVKKVLAEVDHEF